MRVRNSLSGLGPVAGISMRAYRWRQMAARGRMGEVSNVRFGALQFAPSWLTGRYRETATAVLGTLLSLAIGESGRSMGRRRQRRQPGGHQPFIEDIPTAVMAELQPYMLVG